MKRGPSPKAALAVAAAAMAAIGAAAAAAADVASRAGNALQLVRVISAVGIPLPTASVLRSRQSTLLQARVAPTAAVCLWETSSPGRRGRERSVSRSVRMGDR